MATQATFSVPTDSTIVSISPNGIIIRAVLITNHSGDNVAFDNSVDPVLIIPPGVVVPINVYHLIYTIRVRTATNTTGSVQVTVYDSELDTSHAPALQQLPGAITITGTIPTTVVSGSVTTTPAPGSVQTVTGGVAITNTPAVNIGTTGSVSIAGTPVVAISGIPAVSISGTPNVNILTGNLNAAVTGTVNIGNTPSVNIGSTGSVSVSSGNINAVVTGNVGINAGGVVSVVNSGTGTLSVVEPPEISTYYNLISQTLTLTTSRHTNHISLLPVLVYPITDGYLTVKGVDTVGQEHIFLLNEPFTSIYPYESRCIPYEWVTNLPTGSTISLSYTGTLGVVVVY